MNALSRDINKVLEILEYQAVVHESNNVPIDGRVLSKFDLSPDDLDVALKTLLDHEPTLRKVYEHIDGDNPTGPDYSIEYYRIKIPKNFKKDILPKYLPADRTKVKLSSVKISFDRKSGILSIGDRTCTIPFDQNGYVLCRVMFSKKAKTPIDWDVIAMEITGNDFDTLDARKDSRSVQDTVYQINEFVKRGVPTDDNLFTWSRKTVTRNF